MKKVQNSSEIQQDVLLEIPDSLYHAKDKFISRSVLSKALKEPSKLFYATQETEAMVTGRAFHCYFLERHKFNDQYFVLDPSFNSRQRKTIDKFIKENGLDAQTPIKAKTFEMFLACERSLSEHSHAPQILNDSSNMYEAALYTHLHDLKINFKVKADIINPNSNMIYDLKTTSDINNCHYEIKKYNYDLQAYLYTEAFNQSLGKSFDFTFIFCDKTIWSPEIRVIECSRRTMEEGSEKAVKAIDIFKSALDYKAKGKPYQRGGVELW